MAEERKVRPERTEWRDLEMSKRHKEWGWDCPAVDIDFLMIEYDKCIPVAIVEYKHENAKPQMATSASFKALINLGDRANLPVFACRYAADFSWWKVIPLNIKAKDMLSKRTKMTEQEYVEFLYELRGREYLPAQIIDIPPNV